MTALKNKKEKINSIIDRVKAQSDQLKQTLDKIYQEPDINHEREFVSICNTIQKTVKEAVTETGYYKDLATGHRALYAPEELDGDPSVLAEIVKTTLDDIEYPKVNRVYKVNPEAKGLFDVFEELVNTPTTAIDRGLEDEQHTKEYWQEVMKSRSSDDYQIIFDEEIIAAAKGFMVGPVGIQRKKGIMAETFKFPTLAELKIFILNVMCKRKDMYLYMTLTQQKTDYTDVNAKNKGSFEFIEKLPKVNEYVFRGVFLDRE